MKHQISVVNHTPQVPVEKQNEDMFGLFNERVVELFQHVFTPIYKRVWEQNWNNAVFAYARRPYYYVSFQDGVYEIYVPIGPDGENIMHYWRIALKVHDELDQEILAREQKWVLWPWTSPMGKVDSETIIHIARTITKEMKVKLKNLFKTGGRKAYFKGLLRGFKHENKRGYFTYVVVNESPEIAVKRTLTLLMNFLKKRLDGFVKKLKLQPYMFKGVNNSLLINILLENYSLVIRTIAKNFIETLNWLKEKLKDLYAEIGRQNVEKTKIKPLIKEIRNILSLFIQPNVFRNPAIPDPPIIQKLLVVFKSEKG